MGANLWLERLKNRSSAGKTPTKPTEPDQAVRTAGSVGFAGIEPSGQRILQEGRPEGFVGFVGGRAGPELDSSHATHVADETRDRDQNRDERGRAGPDPNRWCYPQSSAMNSAEISAFDARVRRFTEIGLALPAAEELADALLVRDRDGDDRRLCVECKHLGEQGRCVAAVSGRLSGVAAALQPVQTILKRCDAFDLRKGLT